VPHAKTAGNAWDHRRHVAGPSLRGPGRDAFIVPDASRDEDATRSEQDVDEAKLLRLGHAPRMDVLATDSVGVVLLTLQHRNACAAASQNQREGRTSNSSTDDHDIAMHRHGPTSAGRTAKRLTLALTGRSEQREPRTGAAHCWASDRQLRALGADERDAAGDRRL